MEEVKKENLDNEIIRQELERNAKDKKNTFTLIYILFSLFGLAVLGILIYAFIVTR